MNETLKEEPCESESTHAESGTAAASSKAGPDAPLSTATARIGHYIAEIDELRALGWNVEMRTEYHDTGSNVTAQILSPGGLGWRRFSCFQIPPDGLAERELSVVRSIFLHAKARPLRWEDSIPMNSILFPPLYMAWRDHYTGAVPKGWPFPQEKS